MSKLYVIIGGAIVVALFTALIGPWFVNWNDYKATFETEAEKILGRPVTVVGSASATLLPSPSLTFEDVSVGEANGAPMMTVDRFEVTIELMPLLQGEFRVVSMRLDRPNVRVNVSADGRLDWQSRNEASRALEPDKVILESVEIADGHLDYVDEGTGTSLSFDSINAVIEATSLFGPWRVEGSYLDEGTAVPFRFATGRRLDDGTIRVKTEVSPAEWPVAFAADGVLGSGDDGIFYDGTYNVTEVVPAAPPEAGGAEVPTGDATGWRSDGKFRLTRQQLAITQAVLSEGPAERPFSIAGSLTVDLGLEPKFEAHASARQIDLDRSLGKGPTEPVEVSAAAGSLVGWLTNSFVPKIPGTVFFSVPGIVVGGAVIQDVAFEARPTIGGWRLARFNASLPGQARLEARGVLATDYEVSFAGDAKLTVNQPAVFATWWRGRSEDGSGRLLAPFELAGRAEVAPKRFAFEDIDAVIGDATITGRFAWSEAEARKHRRILETELVADSVDFTQLKALGELIAGKDLANSAALADSYDIKFAAGTLQLEDVTMREVAIDASFADDALTVSELGVGDLGGASLNVTQGKIEAISTKPRGHLDAQLEADTLAGFTRVVERALPGHPFSQWLTKAAPSLTPAFITASIEAPPQEGGADFRVNVSGVAASTTLSAVFDLTGGLDQWRQGTAGVEILLDSPDAAELSRQAGIATGGADRTGSAHVEVHAKGVPSSGLETRFAGDFAGVGIRANGRLALAADAPPVFAGSVAAAADDIEPLMRMVGLDIPGAAAGTPVRVEGNLETRAESATVALNNGQVADRIVGGRLSLARSQEGGFRVDGDLRIDAVDLGWITALNLGFPIVPAADPAAPWAKAPFADPGYGPVSGRLTVAADELIFAEGFAATGASMTVDLQPNRIGVDLANGKVAGGTIGGSLSIHNVGGNANASGRFDLRGAALESLVWRRGGRAVATGALDLSAEFEAAGRSPAGLVSSLTGGGTIAVHDGEARYVNPQAARLVIKAADLGQEFTENELADAFGEQIDGGSLPFARAEGAFAVAAGAVRLKSLAVESEEMRLVGNAVVDLNSMTIDSDWTAAFKPADDKVEGTAPQVGIVFRGPLDAPARILDVVQFGSYLNIRQEERLLEILSQAETDRMERDRLNREKRKLSEDAARRAREAERARIAAEAERQRRAAVTIAGAAGAVAARIAAEEEAARIAAAEAARKAAEEEARRRAAEAERQRLAGEETARRAAEAAARIAAEEEAVRVAAEAERQRLAAEEAARQAAEEAARKAAEEAAARIAAEAERQRLAAEEAARRAAEEAARKAAEEEAARIAAEAERQRLAAEEAARRAAEEAARKAAEEAAARIAAEAERQRLAAEEAARKAAEDAARRAAEEEAARRAAEEEAARIAAEAEQQRLAAEEAARRAAEEEARVAAEEAARKAAEEEKIRLAALAEEAERAAEAAARHAEIARARDQNSRAARVIALFAASGAADAARLSTNGITPLRPAPGGVPPLLDFNPPPPLIPQSAPAPTPRPKPPVLSQPIDLTPTLPQ